MPLQTDKKVEMDVLLLIMKVLWKKKKKKRLTNDSYVYVCKIL